MIWCILLLSTCVTAQLTSDDKVWISLGALVGIGVVLACVLGFLCGYGCRECMERRSLAEHDTMDTEHNRREYTDEFRSSSDPEYSEYENV